MTAQAADASLISNLSETMSGLLAIVEQETELVRAGKLTEASALADRKTDLSRTYMAGAARLKAGDTSPFHAGGPELESFRRKHDLFQALLQVNLTVLATAHAVSEGIMRGVHEELARKAAPSVYGASGRASAPPASASQPLAVSRVL